MDLAPYVDQLRRELAVAAEAGGEDARMLAERLAAPLESAARLALLEALSAAAEEITRDLAPGSVDVRLRGRDAAFVVTPPPAHFELDDAGQHAPPGPPATPPDAEDSGTARITLRLPEHLKSRIEQASQGAGLSVNAWLVRAVAGALDANRGRRTERDLGQGRFTGWVR
jgi:hypothetical protein